MGAKKGGKKTGGKKSAKKDGDEGIDMGDLNRLLQIQVQALQQKIVFEQERADKAKASENEIRQKMLELNKDVDDEKRRTNDIVCDMTRQYKSLQEDLVGQINNLQGQVKDHKDTITEKDQAIYLLTREKEDEVARKDEEIRDLKRKIEEMSNDFARMLQDTLNKMQERIELANNQWESENDANVLKRFQDFTVSQK